MRRRISPCAQAPSACIHGSITVNVKLRSGRLFIYIILRMKPGSSWMLRSDETANIAVRSGAFCVHSWFNYRKCEAAVRASVYLYNTEDEARKFVDAQI